MKASLPAVAVLCSMMLSLAGHEAAAQTVYRCGSSYSQSPCPAAVTVNVDDPRTAQQKQEAEAAARRDAKTADGMEKSRLKQEAMDRPAQVAAARAAQKALAQKLEKEATDKKQPKKHAKKKDKESGPVVFSDGKKKEAVVKGAKGKKGGKASTKQLSSRT